MSTRNLTPGDLVRQLGIGRYAISYSVPTCRATISIDTDGTWWLAVENAIELMSCVQYADYASACDDMSDLIESAYQHN